MSINVSNLAAMPFTMPSTQFSPVTFSAPVSDRFIKSSISQSLSELPKPVFGAYEPNELQLLVKKLAIEELGIEADAAPIKWPTKFRPAILDALNQSVKVGQLGKRAPYKKLVARYNALEDPTAKKIFLMGLSLLSLDAREARDFIASVPTHGNLGFDASHHIQKYYLEPLYKSTKQDDMQKLLLTLAIIVKREAYPDFVYEITGLPAAYPFFREFFKVLKPEEFEKR